MTSSKTQMSVFAIFVLGQIFGCVTLLKSDAVVHPSNKRFVLQTVNPHVGAVCEDTNTSMCQQLRCDSFPDEANKYCPATCGLCQAKSNVCEDASVDCPYLRCDAFPNEADIYCPKSCGRCRECTDYISNCSSYDKSVCTNYRNWALFNCARTCELCDCFDKYNCSALGDKVCLLFPEYAKTNCKKHCNKCDTLFLPYNLTTGDVISPDEPTTSTQSTTTATSTATSLHTTHAHVTPTALTTKTTTPSTTTTTLPPIVARKCDKLAVISNVAQSLVLTDKNASSCKDGSKASSEAVLLQLCHAPVVEQWRQGIKVMDSCDRIPPYTPISTFLFGRFPQNEYGLAGIFLGCDSHGFKAAIQVCGSAARIIHLVQNDFPQVQDANSYFIIDW